MHFQITKKMIDWLKPEIISKNTDNDFYAWHVNFQFVARKRLIVIMNDLTRFSVVLYGLTKKDFTHIDHHFYNALYNAMSDQGISESLIKKYLDSFPVEVTYGKTKDRKHVGRVNIIMDYALHTASIDSIDFEYIEQRHISKKINTLIYGENHAYKEIYYPHEKMLEYLKML